MGKILNRRIIRRKEDIRQLAHGQTGIIFGKNLLPTGRTLSQQRMAQSAKRKRQDSQRSPTNSVLSGSTPTSTPLRRP